MECIGTFFFILTIALTFDQFAIGAMLMAWIYIGYHVSGGHYNPAVSLAMTLRGRLDWHEFFWYAVAQICGGFLAFAMTVFIHGHYRIPAPGAHVTLFQAFIVEVLLSFVFAFLILVLTSSEKYARNTIFGLAIGSIILALASIGGPISGGLFNPAIAIGAALLGLFQGIPVSFVNLLMYVGGAAIGAILAAWAFHYFVAEEDEEIVFFQFYR